MATFSGLKPPKRKRRKEWGRKRRKPKIVFEGLAPPPAALNLVSDNVQMLTRLLGSERRAKRVSRLLERWPRATIPEMVVYDWLEERNHQFVYQGEFGGGRSIRGGIVPDFVVNWYGKGLVLRVQGEYWHNLPGQKEKDLAQAILMMGQYINGLQVAAVVDIWEDDLYKRLRLTMTMAMAGIGLR